MQAVYLFFVAATIIRFYIDLMSAKSSSTLPTTCEIEDMQKHWTESCFIVRTGFFAEFSNSHIILHLVAALLLLLSGGFAIPVFQLFITQSMNFLAGQTTLERLGRQQGKKVELATLFNANEPLLTPASHLVETRFLYRELIKDAQVTK